MPRKFSVNFQKLNAELAATDAVADPLLAQAKITTLKVNGADVSATDAPLDVKLAALGALLNSGDTTQDNAQLIAANGQLAAQVEEAHGKLVASQASASAAQQKVNELTASLDTASASVTSLTAQLSKSGALLKASTDESVRLTGELNATKRALAEDCIAVGCLALNGADGKPLAADASLETKVEAALKLTSSELRTSFKGAVNTAMAKTGLNLFNVPDAPPTASAPKKELTGRARFVQAGIEAQSK